MAARAERLQLVDRPPECVIIKELVDGDYSDEYYEQELERALEACAKTIVIEPVMLGDETGRWIRVGNTIHKLSVLSGGTCLLGGFLDDNHGYIYISLGVVSVLCAGVYTVSWQLDPCCKYQVEDNMPNLERLVHNISTANPVVLVRKDDGRRKILHSSVSLCAMLYCLWKGYKWFTSTLN